MKERVGWGSYCPQPTADRRRLRRASEPALRKHLDHHAPVLRAALAGVVRRDRLLFAEADRVDLVQRHLVRFVEIPLDRVGTLLPEGVVGTLRADRIRVALDL